MLTVQQLNQACTYEKYKNQVFPEMNCLAEIHSRDTLSPQTDLDSILETATRSHKNMRTPWGLFACSAGV